ncbi:ABC transporter ATP-binding protein [Planctellipticum variicoloris]|uniref:ABC transporter ATP-binding protein n=1 Tax=Planctellipticum variicoloris TaxID=3064265 RepID=UPI002B69DF2A|nr:ABC transporter ATP-binding protein [Planctomycetaceae bacterium SH412]HTN02880.1 ABC transporter ATP-binding protein [Planctomycetaceae bacterium]
MSLQLRNIRKTYREPGGGVITILNIAEFQLAVGEQVVLVGQSGGGKTTLLNVIAGITMPDAGEVKIGGVDITRLHESARDRFRAERIGYVFQTFNLLPAFTALENVLLGMSFGGRPVNRAKASELLDRVGLAHRLHHKPGQLSVGEQQRVSVARALVNTPQILLADEPTANVDPAHQQSVLDLIRDTCREHEVALLMVTHAPEVAGQFERVEKLSDFNRPGT